METIKLTKKQQTIIQIFTLVAIITITAVLMLRPGTSNGFFSNDYSIVDIRNKRDNINSLNSQLDSTISEVNSLNQREKTVKADAALKEEEFKAIKKGIKDVDFELHIPSILVFLDQEAVARDLDLLINYSEIRNYNSGNPEGNEDYPEDDYLDDDYYDYDEVEDNYDEDSYDETEEGMGGEEHENPIDDVEVEGSEEDSTDNGDTEENDEDVEEDEFEEVEDIDSEDSQDVNYNVPVIPGINITTIPIQLRGSFGQVRSFIRELDDIDFIENNYIEITSEGNEVIATIILNVYHIDEGAEQSNEENWD